MTWAVSVVVLGFSLPEGRRLAHDHPPPPPGHPLPPHSPPGTPPYNECDYPSGGKSCDGDPQTADCDVQDDEGEWTRSCDMHHSTSCDDLRDCTWPPPPPLLPAPPGGYSPPPSPPPEEDTSWVPVFVLALILILVLVCCLLVLCCYDRAEHRDGRRNRTYRSYLHYWCCCCVDCCRPATWGDSWEDRHEWVPGQGSRSGTLSSARTSEQNDRLAKILKVGLDEGKVRPPPAAFGGGPRGGPPRAQR